MAGKKYYAVKVGRVPGVYVTWKDCKRQIDKFSGAIYKSFPTPEEAAAFVEGQGEQKKNVKKETNTKKRGEEIQEVLKKGEGAVSTEDRMIAYVDGSYNIQTKEFSYGMVILYQGQEMRFASKVENPSLASMRNVAGEIKGAEMAMRYAIEKGCKELWIYHDYEGIARWCLGDWKTNKEGTKAYKAYYDSIKNHLNVTFHKVKGHSGDKYNDIADQLAKSAIF